MMRSGISLRSVCAVAAAVILCCCSRPDTYESFIRSGDAADGLYEFRCELDDSLSLYDISFYTATPVLRPLGLEVAWKSPSGGVCLSEKVYMLSDSGRQLYRSGVGVDEPGEWCISVKPDSTALDFRGLGIICKRNGTR